MAFLANSSGLRFCICTEIFPIYLLTFLKFQEVCLVAKFLLEDIHKCFVVSNLLEKEVATLTRN